MPTWMPTLPTLITIAGTAILAAGLVTTAICLSKRDAWSSNALIGPVLIVGGLMVVFSPEADADLQTRTSGIAAIRVELSRMDLSDPERVYFLHRLDPQSGFLGARIDVTLDDARAVLAEARAARDARKKRATPQPNFR